MYVPNVLEKSSDGERVYDIYSRLLQDRIIILSGEIDDNISNSVVSQLLYLDSVNNDNISIYINSPGGSITAGMAIYDTMNFVKSKVSTICIGMSASMAAFLLSSGEKGLRFALPNSEVMIHQPLGGASGQATEIKIAAERILKLKSKLNKILSQNTGKPLKEIENDTERDYFLDAKEALNVEIVPSKVNVELNIKSPSKTVPIKVVTTGELGFGKAISNIDMSEQTVTVYGTEEALEKLEYVPLEVDVTGLKDDKDYKMNLTKPKGVRSMAVNNVTLNFTLGDSSDTDIKDVNIDVRNLDDKYSVQGLTENDIKVTVNVKGVASVLKGIEASDITAYIDLEGYAPGEYEVPVMVEGTDSRVQYLSKTKKVKIKVVEK